jgi:hypothetical protein
MRLIIYLYFLLRLQMSAVVTVLVVNVFMVYRGTALPFTVVLGNECNMYMDVVLCYRKWGGVE